MKTVSLKKFLSFLAVVALSNSSEDEISSIRRQWCPKVRCINTSNCKPCERMFLFIISQGRAGSTTLKNMINLLPGIRIGGETGRVIKDLVHINQDIEHIEQLSSKVDTTFEHSWGHYKYSSNFMSCPAQSLMIALNPTNPVDLITDDSMTIIGSKEVKITKEEDLDFLIENFPCSRFIFNIRSDPEALSKSRKNAFGRDHMKKIVDKRPELFEKYSQKIGTARSFSMDMVSWSKGNGAEFNELASWMGYKNCVYDRVLHDNSGGNKYSLDDQKINLGQFCHHKTQAQLEIM